MDLKQIEKLMAAMEQSRIKRIAIKREDFEIEIERECAQEYSSSPPVSSSLYTHPPTYISPLPLPSPMKAHPEPNSDHEGEKGLYVTSPMVGTFYASPSPEDPPFVKVGDVVSEDTVVCIIEAMKVMNEVKAGVKGTVAAVLVRSGEPVEFGTHILRVAAP